MDRPLQIQRQKHPSRFLITTLTLLVSLSTLTACATQELSKTDSIVHRTITNDKYNKTKDIFHQNDSETRTTNTEQSLVTNKSSFLTDSDWNSSKFSVVSLLKTVSTLKQNCWHSNEVVKCARDTVMRIMRDILISPDSYEISNDVRLNEGDNDRSNDIFDGKILRNAGKNLTALQEIVLKRLRDYEVKVNLPLLVDRVEESARAAFSWFKPAGAGKSSFLTGFGLGFLAFGLKKLLLPIFLGAQIVKSVLIAMFLPSILGGLGKLVGKGVSTFASASGSSGPSNNNMEDFDFKDNMGFDSTDSATADSKFSAAFTYPEAYGGLYQNALTGLPAGTLPAAALYMPSGSGSIKYITIRGPTAPFLAQTDQPAAGHTFNAKQKWTIIQPEWRYRVVITMILPAVTAGFRNRISLPIVVPQVNHDAGWTPIPSTGRHSMRTRTSAHFVTRVLGMMP
ncbi:hypothetical protein ANN_02425 [Periplaneta americana]|uniref:Uncharacterized protein n=1 Tax=Periplaneta americana TaxID=6978 RepID=A0ABQ8U0H9_PERAM|nr:hypothetical protein ANN_02425 [Periplaneta americana]